MTIKPKWVQWDAVGFASDSRVQNLPEKWKGFYFLLLNSLAIDGSIEWDEEDLVERFGSDAPSDAQATLRKVRKLFTFFESRTEDGVVYISHPKMDHARDHFFKYIEQKKLAGRKGGLASKKGEATSERRSSDAQATLKRRSTSAQAPIERVDLDLDLSSNLSGEKKDLESKDPLRSQERDLSEREKTKRREEVLGLHWAESLGTGDRARLIANVIEALQRTRKTGKMANGLMNRILFRLSENEPTDVDDACRIFLEKHNGKSEKYLFGIIRSLKKEREGGKT